MSKTKMYVNLVTGNKVTEDVYNSLSKEDKAYYDKINSAKKAKMSVHFDEEEE